MRNHMAQQTAQRLTIQEHDGTLGLGRTVPRGTRLRLVKTGRSAGASLQRRESLQRRLLGSADLLAAAASLLFMLMASGSGNPGPAILVGTPLVVVLFKVAGLYDRDSMRMVHSTLDEAPALLQITGLY